LTGAQRHNLDYLLENIVDPSATLVPNFRMSTIALTDGRIINGVVLTRTETSWEVQTPTDKVQIPVAEIEESKDSGLSLMPEGLLDLLSPQQIADLTAYLMATQQVGASAP
jgi:putative heme-binding domain-containing protein